MPSSPLAESRATIEKVPWVVTSDCCAGATRDVARSDTIVSAATLMLFTQSPRRIRNWTEASRQDPTRRAECREHWIQLSAPTARNRRV